MAEGKSRETWEHTSLLAMLAYNLHRDAKAPAKEIADFNPHLLRERRRVKLSIDQIRLLVTGK
jgi:hypothetical protein